MIKMVYDIEEKDLENMKYTLDRMEESRYFSTDPTILNAVQLLSEQISALQDDIEQKIDDSRGSGKFDEFDEVLQLYLYDKDYS
tara:strand:- start:141 stop:392 length:252 start_codon:yes stop_codon:yes gene_type:complete